jgi:hypothetical protein
VDVVIARAAEQIPCCGDYFTPHSTGGIPARSTVDHQSHVKLSEPPVSAVFRTAIEDILQIILTYDKGCKA